MDGALAMVGHQHGCLAYLKNVSPSVLTIPCDIHRQHLVAKHFSERLNKSMNVVFSIINKIKLRFLNDSIS